MEKGSAGSGGEVGHEDFESGILVCDGGGGGERGSRNSGRRGRGRERKGRRFGVRRKDRLGVGSGEVQEPMIPVHRTNSVRCTRRSYHCDIS